MAATPFATFVPLTAVLVPFALLAACSDDAPSTPGWAEVAPILAAGCVRCHGAPAIGGAPPTFRLDRYDDTDAPGGKILGAAAMAEWIAERAADGSMPPRFPLSDYEVEVLGNWAAQAKPGASGPLAPPRGSPRPDNHRPTLQVQATSRADAIDLSYELRDPDRDLVVGALTAQVAGQELRLGELRSGRGVLVLDTATLPAGTFPLTATVDDGAGELRLMAGEVTVTPPRPAPPRLAMSEATAAALAQGSYLAAAELPFPIELDVRDSDTATVQVSVELIDDREPATVVERKTQTVAGGRVVLTLGSAATPAGVAYRVVATVSDDAASHRVQSGRFRIADATTADTFASIAAAVLGPHCLACHGSFARIPGLTLDFTSYRGTAGAPGVFALRRRIFQRAVVAQTMPPGSARRRGNELPVDLRDRLARWLLAGAPEL
ncbi:MAG: hypothetical protein IPI49_24445 [Myxococcales bacterium]|nr:hypothetical protein [Myxococcales bacterium]